MHSDSYLRLFSAPFRITEPEFLADVEEARKNNDALAECRALIDLAFARIHMGSAASATPPAELAISLAQRNGWRSLEIEAQLWRDVSIHFSNDPMSPTAFDVLAEHLADEGLGHYVPVALILRARERDRIEGRDAADVMIDRALNAVRDIDDPYVRAFVYRLAGMLLRQHDQFTTAITLYEEARSVAEHAGYLSQLARSLGAIGSAYVADQRPKEGLTELLRALELYEQLEINDWYVAEANENIAILHDLGHDQAQGVAYAMKAIELFVAAGDLGEAARAENVLGGLYERCGELDLALKAYISSDARFRQLKGRHRLSSLPLANAANILVLRKQFGEALRMLDEALDRAITNGSAHGQAQANAYLGAFFDIDESPLYDPRRSEEHLLRAYQIERERNHTSPLILEHLAKYYEHHEDFERALRYTKELYDFRERIRDETAQRRITQLEARRRIEEAHKLAEIEHLRNVELKAAQTQLVESEKMASLGQLTAGIAHEINNPVTFIASSIAPLRRDLREYESLNGQGPEAQELRKEILELLNGIETGARRTSEIVKSLRVFSRLDEGSIKKSDLVAGIDSTLTLLNSRIRGHVELVKEIDPIEPVECRPGQINQVFMNILSNALDALEHTPNPKITISVTSPDSTHVQVRFADNGPGVPTHLLNRLFEPFFTTKDVGKGTGLGLSISYGIIERHFGRIDVSNDGGAVFTITLPTHQPQITDHTSPTTL